MCAIRQSDDVIIEAESSLSASEDEEEAGDGESDIRQLKARRHALANKLAQQQKRKDKIQVKAVQIIESGLLVRAGPVRGARPCCDS